jgi:hypothetical protein
MDVEQILRWFAELQRPYQFMIAGSVLVGMMAVITALGSRNPLFLLIAVFWFFVAPAAVKFASARE